MRVILLNCFAVLLLGSCESRPAATTARSQPAQLAVVPPHAALSPALARPDTLDVSSQEYPSDGDKLVADTLLCLGTHHYRLRLQAQPDSSQELKVLPTDQVAVDSVPVGTKANGDLIMGVKRYYNVRYSITLLDSAGHPQFQRAFTKPDFYKLVGRELVRESYAQRPLFIGYNAPRQWLLFQQGFWAEGTDWGGDVFLALDLKGHIQRLTRSNIYGGGGSDCRIQQSPDGQAVITCEELLLPGGRHQSLSKPHTELVAARFLSDTTLLTVYEYVTTRRVQYDGIWGKENVPNPRYQHVPNAFIRSARTGKVLARFRFDGAIEALGYNLPLRYVWQTNTYYLPDDTQKLLRVIPKDQPQHTYQVSYQKLPAFKVPKRSTEMQITLDEGIGTTILYVDTVTHAMRCQVAAEGK